MPPIFPSLYEINTRVLLTELSMSLGKPAMLDDVPDATIDTLAGLGFDYIWLLGVWQTGEAGRAISLANPQWRAEYQQILPDLQDADISGSPFAIKSYTVHTDFGGDAALARFRDRLHARNLRLILDFVPNHTALDHPWSVARPDFYVQGTAADLARAPQNYIRRNTSRGSLVLAHGKDPYFPGWPDTLQLDYRSPRVRAAMADELASIASRCDGVRCDMAMLLLTDIFLNTWQYAPLVGDATRNSGWTFWPSAIACARQKNPEFLIMAEAYWDREFELQQQGFDFTYDKKLYDRLLSRDANAIRSHLWADVEFQKHSVRFLENHDEPRIASQLPEEIQRAAGVIAAGVPGMRFFHDGQLDGRRVKLSVHLGRRPEEPLTADLRAFYERLLKTLQRTPFRDGAWRLLESHAAWEGNPTHEHFLVFAWESADGKGLICVNFGDTQGQCLVQIPWEDLGGKIWRLSDQMSAAVYDRPGFDLKQPGLYLDLPAWGYNIFLVAPLMDRPVIDQAPADDFSALRTDGDQ